LNGGGDQPPMKLGRRRSHMVFMLLCREDIHPTQGAATLGSEPEKNATDFQKSQSTNYGKGAKSNEGTKGKNK
jgi:hypothetical protein